MVEQGVGSSRSARRGRISVRVINPVRTHSVELIKRNMFPLGARPDPDPPFRPQGLEVDGGSGVREAGITMVEV